MTSSNHPPTSRSSQNEPRGGWKPKREVKLPSIQPIKSSGPTSNHSNQMVNRNKLNNNNNNNNSMQGPQPFLRQTRNRQQAPNTRQGQVPLQNRTTKAISVERNNNLAEQSKRR